MALGKRGRERQGELWVVASESASGPRHVFYERLNAILGAARFDAWVEELCAAYYADGGRPGIPPGVFFRMLYVGYFENIDSQRGIAWRCEDSFSLKRFLGYAPHEETPDHSSLSRIRGRLPLDVFRAVHEFVLEVLREHKLLEGVTVGVDSTLLEANAAMNRQGRREMDDAGQIPGESRQVVATRSSRPCRIVRKDSGEDWEAYVTRLAAEDGVELKTKADLIRYDKDRNQRGKKKVSNDEWESPADPDARIAKMKDGTTHLAYKAEHVVDLKTEAILAAEVTFANQADTATLAPSLEQAQQHLDRASGLLCDIKKVVADKGYHAAATLEACEEVGCFRIKTYIAEPQRRTKWKWEDRSASERRAIIKNHERTQRDYGKRLQRRRSEVVERSFAHVCETGGGRRSWLRGIAEVRKRHLTTVMAHNLGLVLRKLLGAGKVRAFGALCARLSAAVRGTLRRPRLWTHLLAPHLRRAAHTSTISLATLLAA